MIYLPVFALFILVVAIGVSLGHGPSREITVGLWVTEGGLAGLGALLLVSIRSCRFTRQAAEETAVFVLLGSIFMLVVGVSIMRLG